jgi:hypothetical protein
LHSSTCCAIALLKSREQAAPLYASVTACDDHLNHHCGCARWIGRSSGVFLDLRGSQRFAIPRAPSWQRRRSSQPLGGSSASQLQSRGQGGMSMFTTASHSGAPHGSNVSGSPDCFQHRRRSAITPA